MAQDLEQLVLSISADTRQIQRALKRLEGETNTSTRKIERQFDSLGKKMGTAFDGVGRSLRGSLAGLVGAFSLREAQSLVDSATRIQNALKVAGLAGDELSRVYDRLFASAQKNAAPLESLATLYGRAAIVQKELGVSSEELLRFTDNVALALRVAGTDAQSASGALLQLSQALGSGVVRADEFNSVLEGALPIAQAAAAGLKEAGGSVAQLRQLIVDGKVSSEAFFRAFEAGAVILEGKVAGSTLTLQQAMTQLENSLTDTAGKLNEATGASTAATTAIAELAEMISALGDFAIAAANGELAVFVDLLKKAANVADNLTGGPLRRFIFDPENIRSATNAVGPDEGPSNVRTAGGKGGRAVSPIDRRIDEAFAASGPIGQVSIKDYAVTGKDKKSPKERADEYERLSKRIAETTAELVAETEAQRGINPLIEDYGYAAEKARLERELLNAAEAAGKTITPALRAEIAALADQYAIAGVESARLAEQQDQLRESMEDMQALGKDVLGGFVDDLMNGATATEAVANGLKKIAARLIDIGLNQIFSGLFPSGGGASGNFLQALFGGFRAGGGPVEAGKAYVVGEKRPELFVPDRAGTIVPQVPDMPDMAGLRSGHSITMTFEPSVHVSGGGNAQEVAAAVSAALEVERRQFTANVVRSLRDIKVRGLS